MQSAQQDQISKTQIENNTHLLSGKDLELLSKMIYFCKNHEGSPDYKKIKRLLKKH